MEKDTTTAAATTAAATAAADTRWEPGTGEEIISYCGGRWLMCNEIAFHGGRPVLVDRRYIHVDCDVVTDNRGRCAACGAPSPTCLEV